MPQDAVLESSRRSLITQGVTGLRIQVGSRVLRATEEFRVSVKEGDCCQIPQQGKGCGCLPPVNSRLARVLDYPDLPLEMRIGNDAPTFDTTYLAGLVFLIRDAIGNHAAMCTGAGRAQWWVR